MKKVLVLGGDGYLGWPTAMHFAKKGYEVAVMDNLVKRHWEERMGVSPLFPIPHLQQRAVIWAKKNPKNPIKVYINDICTNHLGVYETFEEFRPDIVIDYAEQPSAPFSMKDRNGAYSTVINNTGGTINILFAMRKFVPHAHLIKLGTMGEYGTPNIPIEEGWIEIESGGRKDRLPFPKLPGSFYHASKVADSTYIEFACRAWKMRATDLNQGVVYGISTDETLSQEGLLTSFHYDEVFGTVLNRFIVQAVAGIPLTVYGKGGQKRGFLNIRDTLQCVELASETAPDPGAFRVINQFTETFSVTELALKVQEVGKKLGLDVKIESVSNPRVEKEDHFYEAKNTTLKSLGLVPNLLTEEVLLDMLKRVATQKEFIDKAVIQPKIHWHAESHSDVIEICPTI